MFAIASSKKNYIHLQNNRNYSSALIVLIAIFLFSFNCPSKGQTITSFSPASGQVGATVIISGSGFNILPAGNIVFFGATMAPVTSASATQLSVTVPQGSNFLYITVTNLATHLTAYSDKPFNVTTSCSSAASFSPAISVQGGSHNIEICDMDGDGKPDLIIADYFNNTFTVTRNTSTLGSISFAPKVSFPWAAGGQPNEVSIGDFDGDGKPDVAVGGNGGGTFVSVYRNISTTGSISFAARQDFPASSGQGNGNRIIDIDKDGKPDLVSVHWSGNCIWVLRNTSTGPGIISFAAGVSFATTTQPHKIDVGDLDGDSKPEVVITCFTSNTLSVFRNTSTPGNISFAARQDFAPGTVPYFIHIGDLDGDGKADLAVVNRDVATLAVYRNNSTPGNIVMAARQNFATPSGTFTHYGLAYGDLDGDGKPDLAVGNYTLNITSIFRNTSVPGTISFASRVDLASGVSYDVGIDDFDGDGRPDLAVTNSGSTVSILGNICTLIPLPVELVSFTAEQMEKKVLLNWNTASEINNDYFTLERSRNGVDFYRIAEMKGAGNSNYIKRYTVKDENPIAGINYYRLKQTDFNGESVYSEVISAQYKESETGHYRIYPNPVVNNLMIVGNNQVTPDQIVIFDALGKIVYHINVTGAKSEINVNISGLENGSYTIKLISSEHVESLKIFKINQ